MSDDNSEIVEAANEAASAAIDAGLEAGAVAQALESANEETERAEQTAEQIANAAMESERGRRIAELEAEREQWQTTLNEHSQSLSSLREQVAEMSGALAILVLAAPVSQTPPQEPQAEVIPEPDALAADPLVAEIPAPQEAVQIEKPKRKARWI